MLIRSYRRVFKLERRMHKIDPTRGAGEGLNQMVPPAGIPIRGIGYAAGALVATFVLWKTPGVGLGFGLLPWWIRHLAIPALVTVALWRAEPDGRRADLLVCAVAAHLWRRLRARRARPDWTVGGKLRVRWDASDTRLHRGARIHGPATAAFSVPVELNDRWDGLYAEASERGEPRVVEVPAGQTLKVRP